LLFQFRENYCAIAVFENIQLLIGLKGENIMRGMRKIVLIAILVGVLLSAAAWADGETATNLVVVADIRVLSDVGIYNGFMKYLADAYNSDIIVFAIWCTFLTALYGAILGVLMDVLMSRTGLDLRSRKLIEH
jgi:ABC-type Fe3+ transport system permease subunit